MGGPLRDIALALGLSVYGARGLLRTRRWRRDLATRNGRVGPLPDRSSRPRILVHGVSLGETNALVPLVEALANSTASPEIVVSTATESGYERAATLHGDARPVVRFPLDFTWMVSRFLDAVRPDVVVLAESELWPSFTAACGRRGIPVCVVNGRLSDRSYRYHRRGRRLVKLMFRRLALVGAQSQVDRDRFVDLGTETARVHVTGNLKWDAARSGPSAESVARLSVAMGIDSSRPLIVAGSTGPGEEELLLNAVPDGVQLLLAPRRPERWEEVASLVPGIRRRSHSGNGRPNPESSTRPPTVMLLDSLGELTAAYELADAVFVGRSLVPLGGSNPLEAVALGKPTVIGPHHENFRSVVNDLAEVGGIVISDRPMDVIKGWRADPAARDAVIAAGRSAMERNRGASARTCALILDIMPAEPPHGDG